MKRKALPLLCALAVVPASGLATEMKWSGFASIIGGQTLDSGTEIDVGYVGFDASYDDELSINPDSMVGLQLQVIADEKLSATVQLVARGGDGFDVEAEWAYVNYALSDTLSVKAGRIRLPLYYYSDFLDVGYAYHWIRPPVEIYAGPSSNDGIGLFYTNYIGDYELSAQYTYGNSASESEVGAVTLDQDVDNIHNVSVLFGRDILKARLTYAVSDFSISSLGEEVAYYDATFFGVALMGDYDNAFFRSEFTNLEFNDIDSDSWYVSAGYHFGDITPHITFAQQEQLIPVNDESDAWTYGVSWNFHPSAKLKVEYQTTDYNTNDLVGDVDSIDLISFGIDMVF